MKSLLIAALMVLETGATESTVERRHHGHGHRHGQSLSQTGSHSQLSLKQKQMLTNKDFLKHRNMLNEEEYSNLQMYDSLSDKLSDATFIGQAIENNKKSEVNNADLLQVKARQTGPFDRDNNPFEQFRKLEKDQENEKDKESTSMEEQKTEIKYGPIVKNSTSKTKKIITTTKTVTSGSSEIVTRNYTETKAKYQLTEGFEAVKCADEGQVCSCLGSVHYGKQAESFSQMHNDFVSILDTRAGGSSGWLSCDSKTFNLTNSTGGHQCFCVRELAPEPLPKAEHCANDTGLSFCNCYGTVYYGQRFNKDNGTLSFAEMMKKGWTSKMSNGDLLCDENSFDGDPAHGHDKQCFCEADPDYAPTPAAEFCADEGQECNCDGTVYYGGKFCPFDGGVVGFAEMKEGSYVSRSVEGSIQCNNFEFGDPVVGQKKQCFCEKAQEQKVKRCALQDETCSCKGGNMFYSPLEINGVQPASFDEMFERSGFAVKYDVNGDYTCNSKTFGSDPYPGQAMQCFCDDIQYEDRECIQEALDSWYSEVEVRNVQSSIETQYLTTVTYYTTTTSSSMTSSQQIMEEETRISEELEKKLKDKEEERKKIQEELDLKDKAEHEAAVQLEKQAQQEELAKAEAENDAKQAEIAAENAKKAAEQADEKEKFKAQLEAKKLAAIAANKKRDADFKKQQAEATAARNKKRKLQKEQAEKNRLAQLELQAIRTARKVKLQAERQKMRLESQRLLQEFEAKRAATEAARTQQALQEALEKAMQKQQEAALKKAARQEQARKKRAERMQQQWERKQRLAQEAEERQKARERRRQLELERLHNRTLAEEQRKIEREKARKEQEEIIRQREEAQKKRQREIQEQQMKALRAQAIASTEADIKEAQELADRLAEQMEESRKERQRLLDEKRDLAAKVQQQKIMHEQLLADQEKAKKEVAEAQAELAKKRSLANALRTETTQFIQKMREQEEKTRQAAEQMMVKQKAAADKARAEREAAAKAAREADEKEHQAQLEARRRLDKMQAEEHKKEMEAKKAEFEKTFRHLWGPGSTGLSIVYATFESKEIADQVITEAFKDTMASQATVYDHVNYKFKNETMLHIGQGGMHVKQEGARVEFVTSDDRVPELMETAISTCGNENLDIIVVQMNQVGPDYSDWVTLQSTEQDQTNAYYNQDAFNGDKPIAEKRVARMGDFRKH